MNARMFRAFGVVGVCALTLWCTAVHGTIVTTGTITHAIDGLEHATISGGPFACGTCSDGAVAEQLRVPVPGSGDASVEVNGGSTVTINGAGQFPGLQLGRGSPANGTFTVTGAGSRLDIEGNNPFINVGRNDQGGLNVLDGGNVSIVSTTGRPAFMNVGRAQGTTGGVQVSGTGSEKSLSSSGNEVSIIYVGKSSTSSGSLVIDNGGKVAIDDTNGSVIVGRSTDATGTVTVGANSSLDAARLLLVGRYFAFDTDNDTTFGTVDNTHGGNGTVTVQGGGTVSAQTVELGAGGTLAGGGTVIGDVVNDGGTVMPGDSPGTLTVDGDFIFNDGTLVIEIAGLDPGNFDSLDVSGIADFNRGTIEFSFVDGFAPETGERFDFLTADLGLQDFDVNLAFSGLADGFLFEVNPSANSLEFTAMNDGVSTVPLPPSLLLLLASLGGLGLARRGTGSHHTEQPSA